MFLSTRFSAVSMFFLSNTASHTATSDFPLSRAGDASPLCSSPTGFTCFVGAAVPLSAGFCLLRSSLELLIVLILLLFSPS
ncbi:MAG TPA: hypothetical protein VII93_10180 [Anaerolineales bacterium]